MSYGAKKVVAFPTREKCPSTRWLLEVRAKDGTGAIDVGIKSGDTPFPWIAIVLADSMDVMLELVENFKDAVQSGGVKMQVDVRK